MTAPADKLNSQPSEENVVAQDDDGTMSLTAHLEELRSRIIRCLLAVLVGSCVSYLFLDEITKLLTSPVGKLYYMQPGEAFFTYLKIDVVAGFLIALPIIFFQVWSFILPALTKSERAALGVLVPASVILFFIGLIFSFVLILPIALKFFIGFSLEEGATELQALFSFRNYIDFVVMLLLPFGFVFELPLVIIVLSKLGFLSSAFLGKYRAYVVFFSVIIGALLTPPDVISQILLAIPMVLLYEIGYLVVKYILRR